MTKRKLIEPKPGDQSGVGKSLAADQRPAFQDQGQAGDGDRGDP